MRWMCRDAKWIGWALKLIAATRFMRLCDASTAVFCYSWVLRRHRHSMRIIQPILLLCLTLALALALALALSPGYPPFLLALRNIHSNSTHSSDEYCGGIPSLSTETSSITVKSHLMRNASVLLHSCIR